ncbi:MAG: phosphatase PAP2 family protein [Chloroflexi bacterium]|nr:phosphatase PAP2 family protein [Chloroflexota bacterium]
MTNDPLPPSSRRARYWRRLQARLSPVQKIDSWLFMEVNRLPHPPAVNTFMRVLATVMNRGDGWLVGLLFIAVWNQWQGKLKGRKVFWRVAPALWLTSIVVEHVLKKIFRRPRPYTQLAQAVLVGAQPKHYSFPSGHSASGFAGAWLLSRYYPKWQTAFYGLAVLVAFCRVYLGAHYPIDVIAGAVSGISLAEFFRRLFGLRH